MSQVMSQAAAAERLVAVAEESGRSRTVGGGGEGLGETVLEDVICVGAVGLLKKSTKSDRTFLARAREWKQAGLM